MTKREKFGLTFLNWENPVTKNIRKICRRENVNEHSELQIISRLSAFETEFLLKEISNALDKIDYEEIFSTQSIEDESIEIYPPNVLINNVYSISLSDMKELLQEWLQFLNSE